MQHLQKTGVEAPRSGNWPLATLQSIPHSLPKNTRGGGTPSQSNNHCFNKRRRPSRSDGGCCEKGAPSSGEKIVSSLRLVVGRRRRRRRVRPPVELLNEHLMFACGYGVVRWHRKERRVRLRPLNLC